MASSQRTPTNSYQAPFAAPLPTPTNRHVSPTPVATTIPASPPTKQNLKTWWRGFKKTEGKQEQQANIFKVVEHSAGIFGVPLRQSITYANVAISLVDAEGKSYIYGYVPIVVAKCGVYLKEKATNVEGIFRLSGSEKRIKELKTIFDSPDRYGKGLDWDGYTVHDAANVLRRYLNQLPEPIVPLDLYDRFREPLRGHAYQAGSDGDESRLPENFDLDKTIQTYQRLITELPPLNIQLLLYILDLLAVFASKSDENRMTAQNLAAIFQPGMLSHPSHNLAPAEYRLSQDILVFLIENQDHFLIGMHGTAADSQTVQDVQNGTPPATAPSTPNLSRHTNVVGRSASNASAGADSVRRGGGLRRNVSVNSRNSRQSNGAPSPASPAYGTPAGHSTGSGIHRSNTVPSKKSPGLPSSRVMQKSPQHTPTTPMFTTHTLGQDTLAPQSFVPRAGSVSPEPSPSQASSGLGISSLSPGSQPIAERSEERLLDTTEGTGEMAPPKERNVSSLFTRSPTTDSVDKRQPNKLKKKRIPGSSNPSAQSSTQSLNGQSAPGMSPGIPATRSPGIPATHITQDITEHPLLENNPSTIPSGIAPVFSQTDASPPLSSAQTGSPAPPLANDSLQPTISPPVKDSLLPRPENSHHSSDNTLKPQPSANSLRSAEASATDHSDMEHTDDPNTTGDQKEKRRRWKLSRRKDEAASTSLGYIGSPSKSDAGADISTASFGSYSKPRKSFTGDSSAATGYDRGEGTMSPPAHQASDPRAPSDGSNKEEKKGPLGWLKNKMREAKEDKKDREAEKLAEKDMTKQEKEAAKIERETKGFLPPHAPEKQAKDLAVQNIDQSNATTRGKSADIRRESVLTEKPQAAEGSILPFLPKQ